MKTYLRPSIKLLILLGLVGVLHADTSMPYAAPARVINAQRVNLIPLFTWWQQAESIGQRNSGKKKADQQPIPDRPMKAWVRIISVIKSETTGTGWEVEAEVHESPAKKSNARIFLKHPPQVDKARVESLVAEIAQLESSANSSRSSFENATDAYARYNERRIDGETQRIREVNGRRAGQAARSQARHSTRLGDLNAQLSQARDELKGLPNTGSQYKLDTFVMRTGETFRGLPVYDMGLVVK